jgi:hypothetical protein
MVGSIKSGLVLLGLLAAVALADHRDGEDHGHKEGYNTCGCVASRQAWHIDCSNRDVMLAAWNKAVNCTECEANSECERNFLIIQV